MAQEVPTRQRLLDEGMRLFARQGFEATSVGQIERAAGLQPRRGGLYKHFESKQNLLREAVREHIAAAGRAARQIDSLDLSHLANAGDEALGPVVRLVGEWFLAEMDGLENLTRVFEHDGHRLDDLTPQVRDDLVNLSYQSTVRILDAVAPSNPTHATTALMILGPLVALRRTEWTYGASPLDVTDEEALDDWTQHVIAVIRRSSERST